MSKKYIRDAKLTQQANQGITCNNLSPEQNTLKHELTVRRLNEKAASFDKYNKRTRSSKKSRKQRSKTKATRMSKFGNRLENKLPMSEKWFRSKFIFEDLGKVFDEDHFKNRFNEPLNNRYIPDVHNVGYKFIIEVDGSIHDDPVIQYKDRVKDHYYKEHGYLIIRVKAYDEESYRSCIVALKEHIEKGNEIEHLRRRYR